MSTTFLNKVVLVTGAGQGIGKDISILFATHGADLVITDIDKLTLESTAQQIRSECNDTKVLTFHGDISRYEDNRSLIRQTLTAYGRLDVLVNNAGIGKQNNIFSDHLVDDFDQQFTVNVKGMISLIQESVDALKATKGTIINISSIASFESMENVLIHTMTKACVTKLTQFLAGQLGPFGIRVNEVAPAFTNTDMWSAIKWTPEQIKVIFDNAVVEMPLGKVCQSRDISNAVLFLASDTESNLITGHTLAVDGGLLSKKISPSQ